MKPRVENHPRVGFLDSGIPKSHQCWAARKENKAHLRPWKGSKLEKLSQPTSHGFNDGLPEPHEKKEDMTAIKRPQNRFIPRLLGPSLPFAP